MWRKIFTVALLALVLAPCTAMAEFQMGDKEFTLSGNGASDKDFDSSNFSVEAGLGYFFSKNLEGVVRQGVSFVDTPGDNLWNGSTRLGLDYHFDLQRFQPYLGAGIGYLYGDSVKETFIAGPEAGLKTFVNTTTFVIASIEYQFLFDDADQVDDQFDEGRFVYGLGLGFRF